MSGVSCRPARSVAARYRALSVLARARGNRLRLARSARRASAARSALGGLLHQLGGDRLIERIAALIQGTSESPLAGLVSGSLDLDKIDYLSRDARMCGVPYGTVDVDRLLSSLALVNFRDGSREMGVREKGISALESLLFAKYQMYRNVYWHHAVRSATCMFKRAVRATIAAGGFTTGGRDRGRDRWHPHDALMRQHDPSGLSRHWCERRLYKRALDLSASAVPADLPAWIWDDVEALERPRMRSRGTQAPAGGVLIDYPERDSMLSVNLPLLTRGGAGGSD